MGAIKVGPKKATRLRASGTPTTGGTVRRRQKPDSQMVESLIPGRRGKSEADVNRGNEVIWGSGQHAKAGFDSRMSLLPPPKSNFPDNPEKLPVSTDYHGQLWVHFSRHESRTAEKAKEKFAILEVESHHRERQDRTGSHPYRSRPGGGRRRHPLPGTAQSLQPDAVLLSQPGLERCLGGVPGLPNRSTRISGSRRCSTCIGPENYAAHMEGQMRKSGVLFVLTVSASLSAAAWNSMVLAATWRASRRRSSGAA